MIAFPNELIDQAPTPCWLIDQAAIEKNMQILAGVRERTGCKILLALKGFATFSLFPLMRRYLQGTTASGLHEARLGFEEFGGETHVYSPAFRDEELDELLGYVDHLSFNSFGQWKRFREQIQSSGRDVACGIRINPEHSEVEVDIYNPCCRGSRLGVTLAQFDERELDGISGLHVHALCESAAKPLERLLDVVDAKFGRWLPRMEWLNLGGGHHITRDDYDVELLCELVNRVRDRYGVQVYLEPGEACALGSGILVSTVLDILHNDMDIAILDTSASTHMPDVLEMPYRAEVVGGSLPGELAHTYRLGGMTCLAGDVIGDYSFAEPLRIGQRLVFLDMAHYTIVKTTTFNGVRLPSIALCDSRDGSFRLVREFGFDDYRNRLS